jgi:hypothetical protein
MVEKVRHQANQDSRYLTGGLCAKAEGAESASNINFNLLYFTSLLIDTFAAMRMKRDSLISGIDSCSVRRAHS